MTIITKEQEKVVNEIKNDLYKLQEQYSEETLYPEVIDILNEYCYEEHNEDGELFHTEEEIEIDIEDIKENFENTKAYYLSSRLEEFELEGIVDEEAYGMFDKSRDEIADEEENQLIKYMEEEHLPLVYQDTLDELFNNHFEKIERTLLSFIEN